MPKRQRDRNSEDDKSITRKKVKIDHCNGNGVQERIEDKISTEGSPRNRDSFNSKLDSNEILESLKQLASDPLALYLEQTLDFPGENYIDFPEFKKESQLSILSEEVFSKFNFAYLRLQTPTISASIFARRNNQIRAGKNISPTLLAFENYLQLVTQLYYKKTFNLQESTANYEPPKEKELVIVKGEAEAPIVFKKEGRPGRKAKPKAALEVASIAEEVDGGQENGKLDQEIHTKLGDFDILDELLSPLRCISVFGKCDFNPEKWTPYEIAVFESGICKFGKNFEFLSQLVLFKFNQVSNKTISDFVEFYELWKKSTHYRIWKYYKNIDNRNNQIHLP